MAFVKIHAAACGLVLATAARADGLGLRSLLAPVSTKCPPNGGAYDAVCGSVGSCFSNPDNWVASGSGDDRTYTVKNCLFQEGKSVSFISYGVTTGECDACSGKVESVPFGAELPVSLTVPEGECPSEKLCIFAHDGQLKLDAPAADVPESCRSSVKQLCAMCGPIVATPPVSACNDDNPCTVNDQCGDNNVCAGGPKDCSDGKDCTIDSCNEDTGECVNLTDCNDAPKCFTLEDAVCTAKGCDYPTAKFCNDYLDCTIDTCDDKEDKCVFTPVTCDAPQCKLAICTEASGCTSDQNAANGTPCTLSNCSATPACDDGKCTCPCNDVGGACATNSDCCNEFVCNVDGQCVDPCPGNIICGVCPGDGNGEKLCIDNPDDAQVGQATCGAVTCNILCRAVCNNPAGDGITYNANQCNNKGGGNCQNVDNFNGGPCCGCSLDNCVYAQVV